MRVRLLAILAMVQQHPHAGAVSNRPGVFRLWIQPYPYAVDYRVTDDEIVVQRFRHTARRPV